MLRIAVGLGAAVSSFLDDSTAPSEAWRGASSDRLGAAMGALRTRPAGLETFALTFFRSPPPQFA